MAVWGEGDKVGSDIAVHNLLSDAKECKPSINGLDFEELEV